MKIIINPAYSFLTDFINRIPDFFATEGEVIYNGRNVLKRYQVEGVDLIVKSFKIPPFINKVAYSFFRKSKADRSYEHALGILARGCCTPAPIAYIEEHKMRMLNRSYYVSLYDATAVNVRSYMDGSILDAEDVLRSFARFTAENHRAGILHLDYSPGNILMNTGKDRSYSFSLIDINRLHFKKVSKKDALCNFSRLAISAKISTQLAGMYADYCVWDREETIEKINEYSDRFFLKRTIKLVVRELEKEEGWKAAFFGPLQRYLYLRRFRMLFLGGRRKGCVYEKERRLYLSYIKRSDERQVLNRKYYYDPGE